MSRLVNKKAIVNGDRYAEMEYYKRLAMTERSKAFHAIFKNGVSLLKRGLKAIVPGGRKKAGPLVNLKAG